MVVIKMERLTDEKYKCAHCGKLRYLVKVRSRAYLCEECYNNMLKERREKRRIIKEINMMVSEMLS